jgi:hypothetical protein
MGNWQPIDSYRGPDREKVDLWLNLRPSRPLPGGLGHALRCPDAYRVGGKWLHWFIGEEKEVSAEYITHWMPRPAGPDGTTGY